MTEMAEVIAGVCAQHRVELAEARALVVAYREFIEDAGMMPPDLSGAEALHRFRRAVLVAGLTEHSELVADWAAAD